MLGAYCHYLQVFLSSWIELNFLIREINQLSHLELMVFELLHLSPVPEQYPGFLVQTHQERRVYSPQRERLVLEEMKHLWLVWWQSLDILVSGVSQNL